MAYSSRYRRTVRFISCEEFEARLCLSSVSFASHVIIESKADGASSVYAADVDGDGDPDVFSASSHDDKFTWYENLSPQVAPGDSNRDLQFDQQDIVQVLQAAKFLTGEPATFAAGDWNGDGVFDQLDIVAALQTGNYLQGPYAVRAVNAALDIDLLEPEEST